MTDTTDTTATAHPSLAVVFDDASVADLERQAAEAAERAAVARESVAERARVERAARDRAQDAWVREQFEARRPHQAVAALDSAWDALVEHLITGDVPMLKAWREFVEVRAQSATVIAMCAGFVGAPQLARRWDQHHRESLTLDDALRTATLRVAPPELLDQASEALDVERAAAGDAAVAALSVDAEIEAVAYFHDTRGWEDRPSLTDAGVEAGRGGVGRVFTAQGAYYVRQSIAAAKAGGYQQSIREIDETEAARLELAAAHGQDETASSLEADAARTADHAARVRALPYAAGKPTGRKRAAITERSGAAAPTVDPDRA